MIGLHLPVAVAACARCVMNPNKRQRGSTTGEFKRVIQFMEAAASRSFGRTKLLIRPRGWFSNITMTLDFDDNQRATVRLTGSGLAARITHGGTLNGCSKPDPIAEALRLLMENPEQIGQADLDRPAGRPDSRSRREQ